MPGNDDFNPASRRVYKYDILYNCLVSDIKIDVCDLRTVAGTRELEWVAARRAVSRIQFLETQDTPGKRR